MENSLQLGDVFRCKRRGHTIVVKAMTNETAFYTDASQRDRMIPKSRLLSPYRFTRVVAHSEHQPTEHQTVA